MKEKQLNEQLVLSCAFCPLQCIDNIDNNSRKQLKKWMWVFVIATAGCISFLATGLSTCVLVLFFWGRGERRRRRRGSIWRRKRVEWIVGGKVNSGRGLAFSFNQLTNEGGSKPRRREEGLLSFSSTTMTRGRDVGADEYHGEILFSFISSRHLASFPFCINWVRCCCRLSSIEWGRNLFWVQPKRRKKEEGKQPQTLFSAAI